jgi:hypothetical protein
MSDDPKPPRNEVTLSTYKATYAWENDVDDRSVSDVHDVLAQEAPDRIGDDPTENNLARAGFCMGAIEAFAIRTFGGTDNESADTAVGDLLGDLRHYCDYAGLDYEAANARGQHHYEAEIRGEI